MLKTLKAAREKQNNGEPLGKVDLDGSFTALLKRGLIDAKTLKSNDKTEVAWYVTRKGMDALSRVENNNQ